MRGLRREWVRINYLTKGALDWDDMLAMPEWEFQAVVDECNAIAEAGSGK